MKTFAFSMPIGETVSWISIYWTVLDNVQDNAFYLEF